MENSYVSTFIESQIICEMDDQSTIVTDRMGPWENRELILTWDGCTDRGLVSLTPDEVGELFRYGLTRNVYLTLDGTLGLEMINSDIRRFEGAIVCGVLAPRTQKNLRREILEYAKKMGFVTDTMTPVEMLSGTKSLICNDDGTYCICYAWHDKILAEITREILGSFSRNFFDTFFIEIKSDGIFMQNLSESTVFSKNNIDLWREYDIQLRYLSEEFDKQLLLRAILQRAFIHLPCNMVQSESFKTPGKILIPQNMKGNLVLNEFGEQKLYCGKVHFSSETGRYIYKITERYTEYIRELMVDAEKILSHRYGKKVNVCFSGFNEWISIRCNDKSICTDIEREIIALDYAITFLQDEAQSNSYQLYDSIISLLEADSSGRFRDEYFSYLKMLKQVLPDKCEYL